MQIKFLPIFKLSYLNLISEAAIKLLKDKKFQHPQLNFILKK